MPSIRIGFSTDFNLTSEQVGIGTTLPTARLDVAGQILSDNSSGSGGVSTVTRYDGFLGSEQRVTSNISIAQTTKGNLNSLSGEIKISGEVTVTEDTKLTGGRLDSLTVTGKFDLPHGGSEDREDTPEKGSTRFNQDLGQLEFYTGYEWRTVNSYADSGGRGRAYYFGGSHPGLPSTSQIEFVNIATFGNSQYFGDLSIDMGRNSGCSSNVRGISAGGTPSGGDTIEYFTLSSSGSGADFGNLLASQNRFDACSSSTRGVFTGGFEPAPSATNILQYIEIATTGNALDFGDLTQARHFPASCSSPTRGICAGGVTPGGGITAIDVFTIAAKGNAIDFGDLIQFNKEGSAASNSVRGVFAGGYDALRHNVIQYITITSNGNAQYFGDLSIAKSGMSGTGNQTRAVYFGCAGASPGNTTTIDSILYATTGNSVDFGDFTYGGLNGNRSFGAASSDSHGGLGGF